MTIITVRWREGGERMEKAVERLPWTGHILDEVIFHRHPTALELAALTQHLRGPRTRWRMLTDKAWSRGSIWEVLDG